MMNHTTETQELLSPADIAKQLERSAHCVRLALERHGFQPAATSGRIKLYPASTVDELKPKMRRRNGN